MRTGGEFALVVCLGALSGAVVVDCDCGSER